MQLDALKTTTDDRKDCSTEICKSLTEQRGVPERLSQFSHLCLLHLSLEFPLQMSWTPVEIGGDGNLLWIVPRTLAGWLVLMFLCPRAPLSAIGVKKWPIICICTHIKQVQDNNFLNRRFISLVCIQKLTVFARKPVDVATGRGYLGSLSMKPDLYVLLMRPASLRSLQ